MARVVEKGIKRGLALTWLIPYLPESERPAVIAEARTEIEAIDGRRERMEAFLELVPYLPKSERSTVIVDALAEARTIDLKDEIWQKGPNALPLTIVPALVPYLPEPERSTMIAEALAVARSVSVGRNRNEQGLALAQLVPHLPEPERPAVIAEALADARSFDPKNEQESYKEWRTGYLLKTLLTLVPHLPEPERPAVIAEASAVARELDPRVTTFGKWLLPQYLSQAERETMLQNGLRDAWSIQDERAQVEALVELASLLPEVKRRDVLDKASVIAQRIGDDFNRSMALDRLAEVSTQTTAPVDVRGPFPPPESISAEALAAVRNEPNWQKAVDIAKLGPYLQEPLVSEALQIAWSIDESNLRAHALAGLAAHLPEEVLEDVLADASAIEDNFIYGGKLREWALMYMVPSLTRLPLPKLYELWCRTLRTHSRLTRGDLLADVSALGPVIKVLGGERTLLETANAIMRVSRWFP